MTPLLLTPGPLTTAAAVREAMTVDLGSRDPAFLAVTARILTRLVALAPEPGAFEAVPVQGSGTFAVEAMLGTFVPRTGAAAVLVNGVYGARAVELLCRAGRRVVPLVADEEAAPDLDALDRALAADPGITHVVAVHVETTTGQLEPIAEIAAITARHGRRLLVDAMAAFGAIGLDGVVADAVAASSNKCLEGVPGLGFVLARSTALAETAGNAHSVSLDLHAQAARLTKDGQFRFTPPTHVMLALDAALTLHLAEGGVAGRGARYAANLRVLVDGLTALGFVPLLPAERQAPIIVTFRAPADPAWSFPAFYEALRARGFAIYPGSLTRVPSFRVGCIGQVFPDDLARFVDAAAEAVALLGLTRLAPEPS
jgi:2-aminoethylphosphonate-pyruvate transaminase